MSCENQGGQYDSVENVSKIYQNGARALVDVNLKIGKGEFVFLVGPKWGR